jgi:hypothetical protein
MKKIILLTLLFLNFSYFCYSQDDRLRKAEEIQKGYLTKELELTPEELQKFWPVFTEYKGEVRKAHNDNRGNVVATNKEIVKVQEKYEKIFKDRVFADPKRVGKVFEADQKFRQILRKELDNRNKGNGGDKPIKINGKKS